MIFTCDTCARSVSVLGSPRRDPARPELAQYAAECQTCHAVFFITFERVRDTTYSPEDLAVRRNVNT